MPPHWGGWRIRAEQVEFWQGRPTGCTTGCGSWRAEAAGTGRFAASRLIGHARGEPPDERGLPSDT